MVNNIVNSISDCMNCCYLYLECDTDSDISTIRENFLYKLIESEKERNGHITYGEYYFDLDTEDPNYKYNLYRLQVVEMKEIHRDSQLLCDSYLAILLSRKDKELYDNLIKGLIEGWRERREIFLTPNLEYNAYFPLRFPREDENIEMSTPTLITKDEYIKKLELWYTMSMHHFFGINNSLAMITNLEKELMDNDEKVLLHRKEYLPFGRIEIKNEQYIKKMNFDKYHQKH